MGLSSLGVGSGLDLEGLVRQLIQVERAPKLERLDKRENDATVSLSALSRFKSSMTKILDSVNTLSDPRKMSARSAQISGQSEENPILSATATSSAARGNYNISVESLAVGSRAESQAFTGGSQVVANSAGTLTFQAGPDKEFTVDVAEGATLSDIARAINRQTDNFGVSASIVNTGGSNPQTFLVFDSTVTGTANELSISNNNAELDVLSTVATGASAGVNITRSAADAEIDIDGIRAFSPTNDFKNSIQGVDLSVERASPGETIRLAVDVDREGIRKNVDDFISAYNAMIDEVGKLTAYNEGGKNGALIGDSLVRSARSKLGSIITRPVAGADEQLNSLFKLGIVTDNDGKLRFDTRNIGGGTGEERFNNALDNNFSSIEALFSGETGLATQLKNTIEEFTKSGGLIDGRERIYESQKKRVETDRAQFERYMENYERTQRQRFLSLDSQIARLNQSSDFLFQRLAQM